MNKLKEINGKFYQDAEVVMLATEKASIILSESNILVWDKSTECLGGYKKDCVFTPQHLYFLSNEKIKEGDWCYNKITKQITQAKTSFYGNFNWVKIIATTDISLGLPQPSKSFIQAFIRAYNEGKPITKVLVEMEEYATETTYGLGIDCGIPLFRLKLNSSNEVIIKKVKDSWTREEFMNALHKVELNHNKDYSKLWNEIEENL